MEAVTKPIAELLAAVPRQAKVKSSEYQKEGEFPIIDQSQDAIAGYCDDPGMLYQGDLPVVVFGDHTRVLKYIDFPFCIGADGTQLLRPLDGNDIRYFYFALRNVGLRNYGYERHFKYLKQETISLPPIPEQKRIAGILSAYDELIENSQQRIKVLETMARNIYREWFVHYRYPGHENTPLIPSPLGNIPKGWEVASLAELCCRMESGGTPKRSNSDYWEGGDIDWYKTGELWDGFLFEAQEKITPLGHQESTARLFEPGTILMAIYGSPTVGRMGILTSRASCNQAAIGLVANKDRISQIFLFFVLLGLREHFNGIAQGAAQQNISKEKVANASAVVPPMNLVTAFDKVAEPLFN